MFFRTNQFNKSTGSEVLNSEPSAANVSLLRVSLLLGAMLIAPIHVHANDSENPKADADGATLLSVTPGQCVAMTEGQTCYVDVEITWSTQHPSNLCLLTSDHELPIKCWTNASSGKYQQEVVTKQDIVFSLRDETSKSLVVEAELNMAWVYKKRGKPTTWWRIF